VAEVAEIVRRAAPFSGLPDSALDAVLDMLAGRYPSDAFAELRPRLVWDRVTGELAPGEGRSVSRSRAAGRSPTEACSACF
jgi:ATP-dependent Lhr-like helicase